MKISCWMTLVDSIIMPSKNAAVLAAFFLMALLTGCLSDIEVQKLTGSTMGTSWSVTIVDPPVSYDQKIVQVEIEAILSELNHQMSTYDLESEISKFNSSDANGEWYLVSEIFALTASKALGFSEISRGAFDPTVGPLVNLWGFGPGESVESLPTDAMIEKVKAKVGYSAISVRTSKANGGPAIQKRLSRQLDLSAIAKGMGVDQVYRLLDKKGYANFLVEIGGEVRVKGDKDGLGWKVAIEKPMKGERAVEQLLSLSNIALATSGDYRNYREIDGIEYSHTIDPQTGRPVAHQLASVTVVDKECAVADGWATTLLVLGPREGYKLAVSYRLAALLIERTPDGYVVTKTPEYERLFAGKVE